MSKSKLISDYLDATAFFKANQPFALTYDDVSLATCYSEVLPKQTNLETNLSETLSLTIPLISADMDTVTESRMAIAMALQGGLGLIHYNMDQKSQIKEVARVKNYIHGLIQDPITVIPEVNIGYILDLIAAKHYDFTTFPVVDQYGKLLGLLSNSVIQERYRNQIAEKAMTPRKDLHTINQKSLGKDPIAAADKFFNKHMGVSKLLVVDDEDHLRGLFILNDIESIVTAQKSMVKPARDAQFRLVCGVAIAIPRTISGDLDKDHILHHVHNLVEEGVDVVAISVAHGHSAGVGEAVSLIRKNFKNLNIIAGNVTSAEGVSYLAKAGANIVKVGQGPGSICTTRIIAGVGIPQLTALYEASRASNKSKVKILADGGISKSGDIVKALTLADAVVCGSLFAGCKEAAGDIVEINGKFYKQYRGMGSLEAMRSGSALRYGHDKKDISRKAAAEGIEALKEIAGSVDMTIAQLVGGIQSGLGYLGAHNLKELKENARYVRVTAAGVKESLPHDVIELKTNIMRVD